MRVLVVAILLVCCPCWVAAQSPERQKENAEQVARLKAGVEAGNPDAMFSLASAYEQGGFYGWGLTQDYVEARRLYQRAAELGHAESANNLGRLHGRGLGTEVNFPEAMRWYRTAAAKGYVRAMYNIAGMYQQGDLGPMDLVAATAWFRVANDHIHKDPAHWPIRTRPLLEMFFEPCVLVLQMTPADREKAEALYRQLSADMRSPVPEAERLAAMKEMREACENRR
jgi:TPR repeat protein